jgi:hypothetical protein
MNEVGSRFFPVPRGHRKSLKQAYGEGLAASGRSSALESHEVRPALVTSKEEAEGLPYAWWRSRSDTTGCTMEQSAASSRWIPVASGGGQRNGDRGVRSPLEA